MVRLNTRVETIHELLEKLLDDDNDMKDMNLSVKQQVGHACQALHSPTEMLQGWRSHSCTSAGQHTQMSNMCQHPLPSPAADWCGVELQ